MVEIVRSYYPFNLNKRRTKSLLVDPTKPFFLIALLRFVDFLVRMCLLNAFWKVISPVPVTLKRFFALELVFTFGIIIILSITPYWRSCTGETLVEPCGKWIAKVGQVWNIAKKIAPKMEAIYKIFIENQPISRFRS
jgi:hypothetical protein